jgi:hypothetical protein
MSSKITLFGNSDLVSCKHNTVLFVLQPFYGGKKHQLTGKIFDPAEKKPIVTIDGEWNGIMYAKHNTGVRHWTCVRKRERVCVCVSVCVCVCV